MIHIKKKKSKNGMHYNYVPGFSVEGELIEQLGFKKLPRLGEKMKIIGTVEATNLSKNSFDGEGNKRISFEFKEMEIKAKGEGIEDKIYDKDD